MFSLRNYEVCGGRVRVRVKYYAHTKVRREAAASVTPVEQLEQQQNLPDPPLTYALS